jgi:transposase
MITDKIKVLAMAKARVTQLEHSIALGLNRELADLPGKFGFSDVSHFVRAVKAAAGEERGRRAKTPALVKRRKRAKITDTVRARVKKLVKAGKTGSQIAKSLKISLPSVQNIKKAFGLVRTSKKPAGKSRARRAPAKRAAAPKLRKKRVSRKEPAAPESKPGQVSEASTPAPSP